MDSTVQQAREHHRLAADVSRVAEQHRSQRDQLIRGLWDNDRHSWTYVKLARAVGCSPELIAKIIRGC
jgi:hypothetical protein